MDLSGKQKVVQIIGAAEAALAKLEGQIHALEARLK